MSVTMTNLNCSVAAAVSWGVADFTGGQATKKGNVYGVVMLVEAVGLIFMVAMGLLTAEPMPTPAGVFWALSAGLVNGVGLVCFYRALAVGTMGTNASLTGLLATLIPVLAGALTQGRPRPVQLLGIGVGMLSTLLICVGDLLIKPPKGIGLAVIAGCSFGGFLVFSKLAGELGLFWVLAVIRAASFVLILGALLMVPTRSIPGGTYLWISLLAGIFDGLGNLLYVMATRNGRLDITAVLSSFYSAVTVILALIFLRERLSLRQGVGIVAALIAIPLLAHA